MSLLFRLGLLSAVCVLSLQSGWSKEVIWLRGSFQEIGSASPVVGHATFTLELARKVIAATPKKYLDEAGGSGFNINAIFQAIDAMPIDETFEIQKEDLQLKIEKFKTDEETESTSRLLMIKMKSPNDNINLPVPLAVTSTAIPLLQLAFKELEGLNDELSDMLDEVKRTKPGLVLIGEDKLMNSTLEVKLQ